MSDKKEIQIGKVKIGDDHPFVVIPEVGDNHHGNLEEAKELAHAAKEAGAEIVKYQLHLPDEEMDKEGMAKTSSEMFSKWGDLYGFITENLLAVEDHAELIKYCEKIDIQYFCTPFSLKAAQLLQEMGGDFAFKIGSGETEDLPMIESVADMGRPMVVSTGMSDYDEIKLTVDAVKERKAPLSLMHCISTYPPTHTKDMHLGVIRELREKYDVLVGFSDHTRPEGIQGSDGTPVSEQALLWGAMGAGARYLEKHYTIDRKGKDADSNFSHDPETLKQLIIEARAADEAMNGKREVFDHEEGVWIWAKRSMFAVREIKKGEKLTREMLTSKRPGTGIRSKDYHSIIGKTVAVDIPEGKMLEMSDLE